LNQILNGKEDLKMTNNDWTRGSFHLSFYPIPEGVYKIKINDNLAEIKIKRIGRNQKEASIFTSIENYDTSKTTPKDWGDMHGRISYCTVQVLFHHLVVPDQVKMECLLYVNKLIKTVRYHTKNVKLIEIIPEDFLAFSWNSSRGKGLEWLTDNRPNIDWTTFEFENKRDEIEIFLINNSEIPLFDELLLNSKYFMLRREWDLAIMEAYHSLEVFLRRYHKNKLENKKYPDNLIYLLLKNAYVPFMLNELLSIDSNVTLTKNNEKLWDKWKKKPDIPSLRNKIMHGKSKATQEEAERTINAIEDIIKWVNEI
jgi:hypothetical protein